VRVVRCRAPPFEEVPAANRDRGAIEEKEDVHHDEAEVTAYKENYQPIVDEPKVYAKSARELEAKTKRILATLRAKARDASAGSLGELGKRRKFNNLRLGRRTPRSCREGASHTVQ
jgi:hypothetical protein